MTLDNLRTALDELAMDIYKEIIRRLRSGLGVNPRTGTNTLIGSDLEESILVYPNDSSNGLVFQIAQHWEYIVLGWRHTGNFPGTKREFLRNLLEWVKRKNIQFTSKKGKKLTQNQTVWLVYRSINERLIAPRPFINYDPDGDPAVILPFLEDYFNRWADELFEKIIKEIDKHFN